MPPVFLFSSWYALASHHPLSAYEPIHDNLLDPGIYFLNPKLLMNQKNLSEQHELSPNNFLLNHIVKVQQCFGAMKDPFIRHVTLHLLHAWWRGPARPQNIDASSQWDLINSHLDARSMVRWQVLFIYVKYVAGLPENWSSQGHLTSTRSYLLNTFTSVPTL